MGLVESTNIEFAQYQQKKKDQICLRPVRLNSNCSELRYLEDGKNKKPKYCAPENLLILTRSGLQPLQMVEIILQKSGRMYNVQLANVVEVLLRRKFTVGIVQDPNIPICHPTEVLPSSDITDYDVSYDDNQVHLSYPRYHSPFRLTRIYPVGFTVRNYESLLNDAEIVDNTEKIEMLNPEMKNILNQIEAITGFEEAEVHFAKQWLLAPPSNRLPHIRDVVLNFDSLITTLTAELTNEILSAYFSLLSFHWIQYYEHAKNQSLFIFSPFFYSTLLRGAETYSFASVKDWYKNENLLNFHKLIIPIFIPGHWLLAMLDLTTCTVYTYNSRPNEDDKAIQVNLKQYLADLIQVYKASSDAGKHHTASIIAKPVQEWELVSWNVPRQLDDISCGVFVCKFAKDICTNGQVDGCYEATNIFDFRIEILMSILSARIIDPHISANGGLNKDQV